MQRPSAPSLPRMKCWAHQVEGDHGQDLNLHIEHALVQLQQGTGHGSGVRWVQAARAACGEREMQRCRGEDATSMRWCDSPSTRRRSAHTARGSPCSTACRPMHPCGTPFCALAAGQLRKGKTTPHLVAQLGQGARAGQDLAHNGEGHTQHGGAAHKQLLWKGRRGDEREGRSDGVRGAAREAIQH